MKSGPSSVSEAGLLRRGRPHRQDRGLLVRSRCGVLNSEVYCIGNPERFGRIPRQRPAPAGKLTLDPFRERFPDLPDSVGRPIAFEKLVDVGKTTFARALCNSLQVPLIATSVSTWLEPGYLGDVLKRMSAAFAEAESLKPAILFVDELDGIGTRRQRGEWVEYANGVINRALELLDGATRSSGVIVVAATNHPHMIDPALLRSGRLETHIEIPPPDTEALVGILRHHLKADLDSIVASAPTATSKSTGTGHAETDASATTDEGRVVSDSGAEDTEAATAEDGLEGSPDAADSTCPPATSTVSRAEVLVSHHHTTGVPSHGDV